MLSAASTNQFIGAAGTTTAPINRFVGAVVVPAAPIIPVCRGRFSLEPPLQYIFPQKKFKFTIQIRPERQAYSGVRVASERSTFRTAFAQEYYINYKHKSII